MPQLQISVNVTNDDTEVTIPGALVAAEIDEGDLFKVYSQNGGQGIYHVGSAAESGGDTVVQLTAPYQGATATGVTGIFHRDFTAEQGYPLMSDGDLDAAAILSRMAAEVDEDVEARPTTESFGGPTPTQIGRGAIVESGSNSNGYYVRWENGEQVCWFSENFGDIDITSSSGNIFITESSDILDWTFPANFIQPPVGSVNRAVGRRRWASVAGTTDSSLSILGFSSVSDTDVTIGNLIAWGFWK